MAVNAALDGGVLAWSAGMVLEPEVFALIAPNADGGELLIPFLGIQIHQIGIVI